MTGTDSGNRVSVGRLILVPALITLVVTLLRLVGELQNWPKPWVSTAAGGGGAVLGISWLPVIFGPYFALKLAGASDRPAGVGKALGLSLARLGGMGLGALTAFTRA